MGRLTNNSARLALLLILVPAVVAARSAARVPVINGSVNSWEFERLKYNEQLRLCKSVQCMALKSIVRSFDQLVHIYFPNTMARTAPPPKEHGPVPIVRDITLHPEFRKPACKLLATFARNYFDWTVGLLTVEVASLISAGHSECLKVTVSALPRNEETRDLVEYAKDLCQTRNEPNCSAISFK
jgi:hypothetical protein